MFVFEDQEVGEKRLRLFLGVARRLREITDTMPEVGDLPMQMTVEAHKDNETLDEMVHNGTLVTMSAMMPTLPEQTFEVLALRFRPFFAAGEQVNFLNILTMLARHNDFLREQFRKHRADWNNAVFWGGLAMKRQTLPVETDKIISVGFYSKYFHVEDEKMEEAERYRQAIGAVTFEVALISSVWARSLIVANVAKGLENAMIRFGQMTADEANARPMTLPNPVLVDFAGGRCVFQLT